MQTALLGALPANDAQHLRAHMLSTLNIRSVCRLLPITQLTVQLPFRHLLDTRSSTAEH